jgi:catechol 2,3-dioxygenase-like lactoylglutathione lyase family enzyme
MKMKSKSLNQMSMKLNFAYTRLFVNNYETCLQFYRDILGLEVTFISNIDRYAELTNKKIKLTLMCNSKIKEYFGNQTQVSFGQRNDAIALCFRVQDVDEACKHLKQKEVEIVSLPWSFLDWGIKIALVRDPDGNLIELIQPAQIIGSE